MNLSYAILLALSANEPPVEVQPAEKKAPNPTICRSYDEIGSRLKSRRVCMLKSEWDEQKRANRQSIDRAQVQRGIDGGS